MVKRMSETVKENNKVIPLFSKDYNRYMNTDIFVGARKDRNIRASLLLGISVFIGGMVMTIFNILSHRGVVTVSTALISLIGLLITIDIMVKHRRKGVVWGVMFIGLGIFTYYSVTGANDGFAILWTLLVPMAVCFLIGTKYGIMLSIYYELLFIVLFYTPIRSHMAQFYSQTFMNRYPVLYFIDAFIVFVMMSSYQISTVSQMEYEQKLQEAMNNAIAADKAKSRFLAQMSHEIRTPINAVLGMNEMILREATDPNVRDYADDIQVAGKNLLSIINTILDFSKIEDGKMEIVPAEYDFPSVVNNIINSVAAMAKGKNLELKVDIDPGLPVSLFGDDLRISQVVMNLLTNAVKYTEEGTVSFTVREASRNGKEIFIDVDVSDTGIGIRQEDMDKLFESFGRLDEKRNRGIEGTGLGIAIVTKLLEMMGSKLDVKSEYGKGSSFSFRIRQEIIDDSPVGKYTERFEKTVRQEVNRDYVYAPSARILVVDDNEMNCKVAKNLMKQNGIVPDFAFSGEECIKKLSVKFYHIVFLDHMMPKMDGIETLKILKEKNLISEGTVVIALTANAVVGAKDFYLEAGFDDYLSKPIEIEHLELMLSEYLPENLTHLRSSSDGDAAEDAGEEILEFSPGGEDTKSSENADVILARLALEGIDVKAGLGYCGEDKDFYIEMLKEYVSSYDSRTLDLNRYLELHDMKNYETQIHSLKSISKTIGAPELSEKALELEKASGEGDEAFVYGHHAKFSADYKALIESLRGILG